MLVKRPHAGLIIVCLIVGLVTLAGWLGYASNATAQTTFSIENIGSSLGLGTADLKQVVVNIIQWVLGIMALVAVVFIIYGGGLWLTSRGNADKVDKAKRVIVAAVVGLVIILISWAIVVYVIRTFVNVTTNSGPASCNVPGEACGSCLLCSNEGLCNVPDPACGLPANVFAVREILTSHEGEDNSEQVNRCSSVMPRFNHTVDSATVEAAVNDAKLKVVQAATGATVSGTWASADKSVVFKLPAEALYESFNDYVTYIPKILKDTGGLDLSQCQADGTCSEVGDHFEWVFSTSDQIDEIVPSVTTAYPVTDGEAGYPDTDVSRQPILTVTFSEAIDLTSVTDPGGVHPDPSKFKLEQLDGRGGAVITSVDPNSLEVNSGSDNRIEVSLTGGASLNSFTWYRITVQDVQDLCGNPLQPPEVWEFETNDLTAGIAAYDPTGDKVCPDTAITVVFNLSMWNDQVKFEIDGGGSHLEATMPDPSGLPGPNYSVAGAGGTLEISDPNPASPNSGFKVYRFDPTNALSDETDFTVKITTDRIINASGGTLTGQWTFSTATGATCACKPFITSISPSTGNPGQCITLRGRCFTGTTAQIADPLDPEFDKDFAAGDPPISSPILNVPQWNALVTTIPQNFVEDDDVYSRVTIDYQDPAYGSPISNENAKFRVTGSSPAEGPCLVSLSPNEGVPGSTTNASGLRFGSAQGGFTFYNNQSALVRNWTDTSFKTDVPGAAATGTHDAFLTDSAGRDSNALPFTVLEVPPGQITVTDPYPTCGEACVNTLMQATLSPLSVTIDESTLTTSTILLRQCADETCANFTANLTVQGIDFDPSTHRLTFGASVNLDPNTWYASILIAGAGGIKGSSGEEIANANTTYLGIAAYQWSFKTKADPSLCQVDRVDVTPAAALIRIENGTKDFRGTAYASPNSCNPNGQPINTESDPWNWTITPPADADLSADPEPSDSKATVKALQETNQLPLPDWADIGGAWGGKSDTARLTIDYLTCNETADCNACPGSVCDEATHRCTPVISSYTPNGGSPGTWATINGCYFGSYGRGVCSGSGAGCDTFLDCPAGETCDGGSQVVYSSDKQGLWPEAGVCPNPSQLWQNSTILASEVPNARTPGNSNDDAVDGPFSVYRSIDDVSDATNDPAPDEPVLPNFVVNNTSVPGICSVNPASGPEAEPVNVIGQNFGVNQGASDRVTFGLANVTTYNGWTNALLQVLVPSGLLAGRNDVTVYKGAISSNSWPFTVAESTCNRCSADPECGAGFGCGTNNCCAPQPNVTSTVPAAGASDICRNSLIEANFDRAMDGNTLSTDNVFVTVNNGSAAGTACGSANQCASGVCTASVCVGDRVNGAVSNRTSTSVRYAPGLLLRNTEYRVRLTGMRSSLGVLMPDYQWVYRVADTDDLCELKWVQVSPSLWSPNAEGQTQEFSATPFSSAGQISEITGVYEWDWSWTSSAGTVATIGAGSQEADGTSKATATTQTENGRSIVRASATGRVGLNGTVSGSASIEFNHCTTPWSFDDAAANCTVAGGASCTDNHFHLGYCRDGSTPLPDLDLKSIRGQAAASDDLLKQFLFKRSDPNDLDAIGLRVYRNPDWLSPADWYQSQFPFESGSPSGLTVDEYEAVRQGRAVYVAGTNLNAGVVAPQIYLLSYSNDARPETVAIFQQMLQTLRLNTNAALGPDLKAELARDTKRMSDLQSLSLELEDYKNENGNYPNLEAGSYIAGLSTSRWPSWQSTLGNNLGQTLKNDPFNEFAYRWIDPENNKCPNRSVWVDRNDDNKVDPGECKEECPFDGHEQSTCWNEPIKKFICESGSYIYAYQSVEPGYSLYANLEYDGTGAWRQSEAAVGDPCNGTTGGSTCQCFTYKRP